MRLACALLAACAGPADVAPPAADPAGDTGPVELPGPPAPAYDAAGVEAEIAALLPLLPNAGEALQDWRDLFLDAEPPCPGITAPFSISSPFSGCVAPDGRVWAGYAVYTETGDDALLEADASVTGRDGGTFLAAGKTELVREDDGTFSSKVTGTWGGSDLDDWTGPGPSVAVWATGSATSVALYGGVSLDQAAIYLTDIGWDAAACPGGAGEIAVRDPGGWWYTLVLDADCGGCGALDYVGEPLGRACVDLGAVLQALVTATLETTAGGAP